MKNIAQDSLQVGEFFEQLKLPSDFQVLFENESDFHEFFENFYLRNRYNVDDLLDFREYKIGKSTITLDIFRGMCYNSSNMEGIKRAFEKTFLQKFIDSDIEFISQAIADGRTSLIQLFEGFQKNPNRNILKNVL